MTYAATLSRAYDMIERKGVTVTLTYREPWGYDPATGSAAVSKSTASAKGVILPFSQGLRKMAGSNVVDGDQQLLLAALATDGSALVAPRVDDVATVNGKAHTIHEVTPLNPTGDTPILFDCTVRSAA